MGGGASKKEAPARAVPAASPAAPSSGQHHAAAADDNDESFQPLKKAGTMRSPLQPALAALLAELSLSQYAEKFSEQGWDDLDFIRKVFAFELSTALAVCCLTLGPSAVPARSRRPQLLGP